MKAFVAIKDLPARLAVSRSTRSRYAGILWFTVTFARSRPYLYFSSRSQASVSLSAERPLRVAYPAPAGAFLPLWAAQDAGIFKKHGLSVELITVGSSTRGIAAMVSGDLDILAGGGTAGITAQLQGYTDMALFANFIQTFLFSVMVQPAITEVTQLRGKRMGVTRFGGTLDFVARQYIKRNGMEPGKDVTFVQVGAMPDIVVAVSTGALESGVIGVPAKLSGQKARTARAC